MRDDMAKKLVERGRLGGYGDRRRYRGRIRDVESAPKAQSMRRGHTDHKELNENLSPLLRFLESSVGRPWDRVYSEIRSQIDPANAIHAHILQHLYDFVDTRPGSYPRRYSFGQRSFYVNDAGILTRLRARPRKRAAPDPDRRNIKGREYRRHRSVWYEVETEEAPKGQYRNPEPGRPFWRRQFEAPRVYDVLLKRMVAREHNYGSYPYVISKRQLSSREIKALELNA